MGQGPVIGQQQQALRVLVQPPHRRQAPPPQLPGQQVQHRLLAAVLGGGQHPGGLVQHHIGEPLRLHRLAVHGDGGRLRVHLLLRRPGGLSVHPHPALAHQLLYLPPGPPSGSGQDFVQPLHICTSCNFFRKHSIVLGKME